MQKNSRKKCPKQNKKPGEYPPLPPVPNQICLINKKVICDYIHQ